MRIVQMIDALDYGDGVSSDVIHIRSILNELGVVNDIYSKWWNNKVQSYTSSIEEYRCQPDDLIIYHFSGKSYILDQVVGYACFRVLRYHNVTPPKFFSQYNPEVANSCKEGLAQIQHNIAFFDGFLAVSPFNANDLVLYGAKKSNIKILPIVCDFDKYHNIETIPSLKRKLSNIQYFIYVGRMAPNKCVEDILTSFEYYYRFHDSSAYLYLVGNTEHNLSYMEYLQQQKSCMLAKDHVVFTGKVRDEELLTYYSNAVAFLCMSEHEGFCIPLLEAANFNVPVIAYNSCAVPDTMGNSGVLLSKKNPILTAHLMDEVAHDCNLRKLIIERQKENLMKYDHESVKTQIQTLLKNWEK